MSRGYPGIQNRFCIQFCIPRGDLFGTIREALPKKIRFCLLRYGDEPSAEVRDEYDPLVWIELAEEEDDPLPPDA